MASDSDDFEQELRRNLRLRRELGAKAAKAATAAQARDEDGNRDDVSSSWKGSHPETPLDNGGLESLRRELKLRRERDSTDFAALRLELQRRRAASLQNPKSDSGTPCEQRQTHQVEENFHRLRGTRKTWALVALACLLFSILAAVWLLYE